MAEKQQDLTTTTASAARVTTTSTTSTTTATTAAIVDPAYTKWCTDNNLPASIVDVLADNGFQCVDDLLTLTEDDILELWLKPDDNMQLKQALATIPRVKGDTKKTAKVTRTHRSKVQYTDADITGALVDSKLDASAVHPGTGAVPGGVSAVPGVSVVQPGVSVVQPGVSVVQPGVNALEAVLGAATKMSDGPPAHYKLKLTETARADQVSVRKCQFGTPNKYAQEKTLLMIGETGSGKSTMIDAIINHLVGVQLTDELRLHIVDVLSDESKACQTESQTDWITCYTVHPIPGGRLPYTLNIVDTPGFGDTRGMEQDKRIVDQIQELFQSHEKHGIETLNAVCYVVKSESTRLTISQRYVIDAVLAVFGQDLKDNIYVMCSFADVDTPSALVALRDGNVPFSEHYTFNNLWMDRGSSDFLTGIYWERADKNFTDFFQSVSSKVPKSLKLSAEVIDERKDLEDCVEGLERLIGFTAGRLAQLRNTRETLEKQRKVTVEVPVVNITKKNMKYRNLSCPECENTCKVRCGTMARISQRFQSKTKQCKVCKCLLSVHVLEKWQYDWEKKTRLCSIKQLQQEKHHQDGSDELNVDDNIDRMKQEEDELMQRVDEQLTNMRDILQKLDKIALRPPTSSTGEYITMVMRREAAEKRPGWKHRVQLMQKLKKMYTVLGEVKTGKVTSATLLATME